MGAGRAEKIGQTGDRKRWINFRPDPDLDALLWEVAKRIGTSRSAVIRTILRQALLDGDPEVLDVKLETMRLASHTIKVAASRVLKEITSRLPEILKEVGVELTE
jgi:hypothetical protein